MARRIVGWTATHPHTGEVRVCRTKAEAINIREYWFLIDKLREIERIKLLKRLLEEKLDKDKQG